MDYQRTGNNIEVRQNDLLEYVIHQLNEYDSAGSPDESSYSPYSHPIIYELEDGRTIEIPKAIQAQAIEMYMEHKREQMQPQQPQQPQQVEIIPVGVAPDYTLYYVLIVVILLVGGYLIMNREQFW